MVRIKSAKLREDLGFKEVSYYDDKEQFFRYYIWENEIIVRCYRFMDDFYALILLREEDISYAKNASISDQVLAKCVDFSNIDSEIFNYAIKIADEFNGVKIGDFDQEKLRDNCAVIANLFNKR